MSAAGAVRACGLEELRREGHLVREIGGRPLLLVHDEGAVHALDNRCPHMGFALSRGRVHDGVITCPWHHARFELCSGGTFDLFADDARTYPVELRDGEVWVDPRARRDEAAYQLGRLRDGLEQDIDLVLAKACIGLDEEGVAAAELLRAAGVFGATQRDAGWRDGLTILTAMGNALPRLAPPDRPLALYHGMLHVASNVAGQQPHYRLDPLPQGGAPSAAKSVPGESAALAGSAPHTSPARLEGWLRRFAEVRDRDGVERVILTALAAGHDDRTLAGMLHAAATDHLYLDGGHTVDFLNKAFELLDAVGWEHAADVLPSVVPGITGGARMEESSSWRAPVDLPEVLGPALTRAQELSLPADARRGERLDDVAFDALVEVLLGDDPAASATALTDALAGGAALFEVSQSLCYAAALRVGRFHTSNEFGDWVAVLHTFSAASATHRLLQRAPAGPGARGLWHVAMHLYLNRFLNTPAARSPTDAAVAALPADADTLLDRLAGLGDQRQRVEESAAVVYRYLRLGHDDAELIHTLGRLLLREDGEFHSYQMLEASLALYSELRSARPRHAPNVLVALARYLAGHAPTDRATTQTYDIALRLHRGEAVAEEG